MSGRFVGSLLGIVPFVKGDRAVGLAVQRVLFNPPHEFSPVCAKEGMLVGECDDVQATVAEDSPGHVMIAITC